MQFVYRCREVMIAQVLGASTSEGEGCLGTPMAASYRVDASPGNVSTNQYRT
jgi:hypothetical protein